MLGIQSSMMSDDLIKSVAGNNRALFKHLQEIRNREFNKLDPYKKELIIQSQAGIRPQRKTAKAKTYDNVYTLDFKNMTGEELETYGNVFSKIANRTKKETKQLILNLKKRGVNYMNSLDLINELRNMEIQQTNIDIRQALGEFYKENITNKRMSLEAKQLLGVDEGRGFFPKILRKKIILDYPSNNPLRKIMTVTVDEGIQDIAVLKYNSIDGLEAKEVTFQPIRDRILVEVPDTVVYGTETYLADAIEEVVHSELIAKEVDNIFATEPDQYKKHMSIYHNDIVEVEGNNIYNAIDNALNDLPQKIRDNSTIVMSLADYQDVVRYLGEIGLGGLASNPEMIWNRPVTIMDRAIKPIIGDFELLHANYERMHITGRKEVRSGIYNFALPIVHDIRVLLPEAFRIAKVNE